MREFAVSPRFDRKIFQVPAKASHYHVVFEQRALYAAHNLWLPYGRQEESYQNLIMFARLSLFFYTET